MEYTEREHAENLLQLLSAKDPSDFCPAQFSYDMSLASNEEISAICDICRGFIGITWDCPCYDLGNQEAVKRTWLVLEEEGYLE